MKTITLNHDPATGYLTDNNGLNLGVWLNLESVAPEQSIPSSDSKIGKIKELKAAGFTSQEIMNMFREGVL